MLIPRLNNILSCALARIVRRSRSSRADARLAINKKSAPKRARSKGMMRVFLALAAALLCACSSGNTVRISGQSGSSAVRVTSGGLYVNSELLGLPQGSDITIRTAPDGEVTFNAERLAEKNNAPSEGSAF